MVNPAEETVTWRMYQYTMKRYSDESIQGGVFEAAVSLDKTVHAIQQAHAHSPHIGVDGNGIRAFSIQTGVRLELMDRYRLFDCRGRVAINRIYSGNKITALHDKPTPGFNFFSSEEKQGSTSHLPCIFTNASLQHQ